jgi:hypothetical protein
VGLTNAQQAALYYARKKRREAMTPTYDPDALAFFARLTTPPTEARKALYSTLIKDLKAAGVWTKLDSLYILAAADAQAARQNLVANAYNLTASGAPAFTADRGYAGDGSGAYLRTGFTPSTAGGKFSLNSASLGAWSRTNIVETGTGLIGARTSATVETSQVAARSTSDLINFGVNQGALRTLANTEPTTGENAVTRLSAAGPSLYRNGVLVSTTVNASTALTPHEIYILAVNTAGTPGGHTTKQLCSAFIAGGLTDAEVLSLYAIRNTYLTAVGAV